MLVTVDANSLALITDARKFADTGPRSDVHEQKKIQAALDKNVTKLIAAAAEARRVAEQSDAFDPAWVEKMQRAGTDFRTSSIREWRAAGFLFDAITSAEHLSAAWRSRLKPRRRGRGHRLETRAAWQRTKRVVAFLANLASLKKLAPDASQVSDLVHYLSSERGFKVYRPSAVEYVGQHVDVCVQPLKSFLDALGVVINPRATSAADAALAAIALEIDPRCRSPSEFEGRRRKWSLALKREVKSDL